MNWQTKLIQKKIILTLTECANNGKAITAVNQDLAKAFASVHHEMLLEKMFLYGVKGKPLQHITCYLSNSGARTRRSFAEMSAIKGTTGVGISSLFYILYTNDLDFTTPKYIYVYQYADDLSVVCSSIKHVFLQKDMLSIHTILEQYVTKKNLKHNKNNEMISFAQTRKMPLKQ